MNDASMLSDVDHWEAEKEIQEEEPSLQWSEGNMVHLKCLWFIQWHLDTLVGNWINLGSRERELGVIVSPQWLGKEN